MGLRIPGQEQATVPPIAPVDQNPQPEGNPGVFGQALPNIAPRGNVLSTQMGEAAAGVRPSMAEAISARLNALSSDVPIGIPFFNDNDPGSLIRAFAFYNMNRDLENSGAAKLSPDELNKRYPDIPTPFTQPEFAAVADLKYSEVKRREKAQEWIARGPEFGILGQFAIGAAALADPANMLLLGAPGLGRLYPGAVGYATKAIGLTENLATVYGTNAAALAAQEIPNYLQRKSEHDLVSFPDTAAQVLGGAAVGTGLHYLGAALVKKFKSTPETLRERAVKQAIAQNELGLETNLTDIQVAEILRKAGLTAPGSSPSSYQFSPITHPSETTHFMASDPKTGNPIPFAPELGTDGLHAIDNHTIANNLSASPERSAEGMLQSLQVDPSAKLLDLGASITDKSVSPIADEIIKKFGLQNLPENMTLRDLISQISTAENAGNIPQDAVKQIHQIVQGAGFDGYKYVDSVAGQPSTNGLYLFDSSKSTEGGLIHSNQESVPPIPSTDRTFTESIAKHPEAMIGYSPEIQKDVEYQINRAPTKPEEFSAINQAQIESANQILKTLSPDSPHAQEVLTENQRLNAQDAQEAQAVKSLIDCYTKEIL